MSAIWPGDPRYAEVLDFLYHEAELLDSGRQKEWLDLLAEDVIYRAPLPLNVKGDAQPSYSEDSCIFSENIASLRIRVDKLTTEYAWAESPRSRIRHHVSNVRVSERSGSGELDVISNVLVFRSRAPRTTPDIFSGERRDVLRKLAGAWHLAERLILLDQAVMEVRHLAILL